MPESRLQDRLRATKTRIRYDGCGRFVHDDRRTPPCGSLVDRIRTTRRPMPAWEILAPNSRVSASGGASGGPGSHAGLRHTGLVDRPLVARRSGPVLRVGCAMWAYKAWQGRHFPEHLRRREQLPAWRQLVHRRRGQHHLLRRSPHRAPWRSWAAEAPVGFRIVFKLPSIITHEHHLRDVAADTAPFWNGSTRSAIGPSSCRSSSPVVRPRRSQCARTRSSGRCPHRTATASRCATTPSTTTHSLEARRPNSSSASTTWNGSASTPPPCTPTSHRAPPRRLPLETAPATPAPGAPPRIPSCASSAPTTRIRPAPGWQPWLPVLNGWLAEGRSPTVFVHTPDNVAAASTSS